MQLSGEQRIAAPRRRVWEALNDPDILRRAIPGCQSLEKESDNRLKAVVEVKIGPIGARFNGAVTLSDLDPPNGYTLSGEGQGGTVGFAKGAAKVRLADDGAGTLLSYNVDAEVGGRLAQLGGPIIDATAKQLAAKFFQNFGEALSPSAQPAAGAAPAKAQASAANAPSLPGGRSVGWLLALIAGVLIGYLLGQHGGDGSELMGVAMGLLVIVVAGAAFEFGRRAGPPVIVLDSALLKRLTDEAKR